MLIFWVLSPVLKAQTGDLRISGFVKDVDSHPLSNATIYLNGTFRITLTDTSGRFLFTGLKPGKYTVKVTFVGFEQPSLAVLLTTDTLLEIRLLRKVMQMDEVNIKEDRSKEIRQMQSVQVATISQGYLLQTISGSLVQSIGKLPGLASINITSGVAKPVIRGLSFNRVAVVENGVKQEGQQWGIDHGLEIDQYGVGKVDVIKGPLSFQHGSDAIGGVIILSDQPYPAPHSIDGSVVVTGKSNNDLIGISAYSAIRGSKAFFKVRLTTDDYGDVKVPADSFFYNGWQLPVYGNRLKNSAGKDYGIKLSTGMVDHWGTWSVTLSDYYQKVGFFSGSHGMPDIYNVQDDGNNRNIDFPYQKVNHFKAVANTRIRMNNRWLEADVGYQLNHRQEFSFPHTHGLGPQPEGNLEIDLKLNTLSGNVRYYFDKSEDRNQVVGISGQYQQNIRGGYYFLLPDYEAWTVGTYYFQQWLCAPGWHFNYSARFDVGHVHTQQFLEPVYKDPQIITGYTERSPLIRKTFFNLSGGVGSSWQINPTLSLKMNLGTGYKIPTAPELTSNGVHHGTFRHEMGDSTLTSERSFQLDIGLLYESRKISAGLSPFVTWFPNFIYLSPTGVFSFLPDAGQIYRYRQSAALFTGGEFTFSVVLFKNLVYHNQSQYVYAGNLDDGYPLPFIPAASMLNSLRYELPKAGKYFRDIYAEIEIQTTASQNRVARNELKTPGYNLLNFSVGSTFLVGKQPLEIMFQVQNLSNKKYLNHMSLYRMLNLPDPGINVILVVNIPLQFLLPQKSN
jgi:iron complex outermembrane receptor protein